MNLSSRITFGPKLLRSIYTGSLGKVVVSYAPVAVSQRPSALSVYGLKERYFRIKTAFQNQLRYYGELLILLVLFSLVQCSFSGV